MRLIVSGQLDKDDNAEEGMLQEVQYRVYYLAKKLKIDPNVIFYTWTVPESIVAYAHYVNNDAKEAYEMWKNQKPRTGKPPKKQLVYFKTKVKGN